MALRNLSGVRGVLLFGTCLLLLLSMQTVSPAAAGFPCEDVNNDGVCEAGVDTDITTAVEEDGFYLAAGSIVIPDDVKRLSSRKDVFLSAGGNLTVHAKLVAASIALMAGGTITVAAGAALRAGEWLDLSADQDLVVGAGATLQAKDGPAYLWSWNGAVVLGADSKLVARDGIDIVSLGAAVTIQPDSKLFSKNQLTVIAGGNVVVNGSSLKAKGISVQTGGSLVDFRDNKVHLLGDAGWVALTASGSTVDIRGTRFKNLDPDSLFIDADTVMQ